MSDITTTATQIIDLTDEDVCIQHGLSGKRAMMDSARAYVTYHGPIEKWIDKMGLKQSAGYNYRARLLKEGTFKYLQAKPKSDTPDAVRMRNKRADEQIPRDGKCSPKDDSQSSPLFTPEIAKHVTDVQPGNTSTSIREGVCYLQSSMDTNSDRYDKDAVPLGTTDDGRADADHAEVNRLIGEINTIFKRHYAPLEPGTFDGFHWTDFYEQFDSLCRTAEQYSREHRRLNKEHAEQSLGKAKAWVDSKFGDQGNRIGADDEILRLL